MKDNEARLVRRTRDDAIYFRPAGGDWYRVYDGDEERAGYLMRPGGVATHRAFVTRDGRQFRYTFVRRETHIMTIGVLERQLRESVAPSPRERRRFHPDDVRRAEAKKDLAVTDRKG